MQENIIQLFENGHYLLAYQLIKGYEKDGNVFDYTKVDLLSMLNSKTYWPTITITLSNRQEMYIWSESKRLAFGRVSPKHLSFSIKDCRIDIFSNMKYKIHSMLNRKGHRTRSVFRDLTVNEVLQCIFANYTDTEINGD